jgi:Ca-activated chloride channel family protein
MVAVLAGNWVLQTGAVVGDAAAARAAEAKELYEGEQYEEALTLYRDAQLERPESPALHFNTGDVLYRLGKPQEALEQFERASVAGEDFRLQADAFFNMGKTLFQKEAFGPAAEAFKQVLEIDSRDVQAKLHLEMAQERLEEQQQQQQQQSDEEEQEEPGEEDSDKDPTGSPEEKESGEGEQGEEKPEPYDGEQGDHQEAPVETGSSLDREEAERLLDALQDLEKRGQLRRAKTERGTRGKDW